MSEPLTDRVAKAMLVKLGCGCTNRDGAHVLCDDASLTDLGDGYGTPIRREHCECRDAARLAIEATAAYIETDFGWSDRLGVDSKIDKCQHGIYGWEDCEQCITDFLHRASKPPEPTP